MTLKQTITEELLDSVDDPVGLEEVFRQRSRSKGPFYMGLAEATSELRRRLETARKQTAAAEALRDSLDREVETLAEQRRILEEQVQTLAQRVHDSESETAEVRGLLDQAKELTHWGFGEAELSRLRELLAQVAATQGAPPEEGVSQFFQTVERYERIVSLDLEARRAESRAATAQGDAARWESEAKGAETRSKARIEAINLMGELLAQGVKGDDLSNWGRILGQVGVNPERLSKYLDQYASIEALAQTRQERADELQIESSGLESQVTALSQERDNLATAIQAVQDQGLRQIKRASNHVTKMMDSLVQEAAEVGRLRAEASDLGVWVEAARLLRSGIPDNWRRLPPEIIQHFLLVALRWVQVEGRDPQVPPPESVAKGSSLLKHIPVKLSQILLWALVGLIQEDRKPLAGRR